MKNYLLVNRALAAEKNINYFNNLFSRVKEHSYPTVNRRSTDGQSQRQYSIGIWKYVAMMALLLTLACGQAWGDDLIYNYSNSSFRKIVGTDSIVYYWNLGSSGVTWKNKTIKIQVPSSTAKGTIGVTSSNADSGRKLYVCDNEGTKDDDRQFTNTKDVLCKESFTTEDLLNSSGTYYVILSTNSTDYKPYKELRVTVHKSTSGDSDASYLYMADIQESPTYGATPTKDGINYDASISITHTGFDHWGSTSSSNKYFQYAFSPTITIGTYTKLRIHVWWGVTAANRTVTLYVNGSSVKTSTLTTANTMEEMTYEADATISSIKLVGAGGGGGSVFFRIAVEGMAGCSSYSFHTGTGDDATVKTTNTQTCFTQVGSSTEWQITNYTIPADTKYFVGKLGSFYNDGLGSNNSHSQVTDWATNMYIAPAMDPSDESNTPKLGNSATGAKGTLRIYDDSNWNNLQVAFIPDGYGITINGTGYAFSTTGTDHLYETTDLVTLPNVSSTTYQVGLKTATVGTYVPYGKSKSPDEAIGAMGVSILKDGKKIIYLDPNASFWGSATAKYSIWDVTNSKFNGFMTESDGLYVGEVDADCATINLVRLNTTTSDDDIANSANGYKAAWGKKWNQTANISLGSACMKYTITAWGESGKDSPYSSAVINHPATGDYGKFRIWNNTKSDNFYVHFVPYYVLTYDENGGSGTTAQTERNSESSTKTVSVASNGFTAPTGYTFKGWATDDSRADAGTVDYDPDDSYTLTANATLYAVWSPKEYTITLNGNGGSGHTSSVTATYNSSSLSSSITNPARDCYTFDGWYSGEGGTGTLIINTSGVLQESTTYTGAGGIWTNDGAVTLYAKWSKTPTALTVNLGGDPATPAGGSPIGTGYTLTCSASTGVIANYQWKQNTTASTTGAVNAEGTGATTASFNPVPAAAGTYYYYCVATDACGNSVNTSFSGIFQFNAAAYTVTYNKNGDGAGGAGSVTGTVPTDATSYSSGDRVVVKMPGDLALADKTFIGWNDAANGSGTYYSPGANFAITANKTLYAQWRTASSCPGGEGGTVFSLTMGDNSSGSATSMTKGLSVRLSPLAYATVTNGDASFTNTHTSNTKGSITKANPAALSLGGAASTIILYLDCALRKDDQISFTGDNNKEICFSSTTYSRNETLYTTSQAYTIPSGSPLIGSRILYIWRKGGDTFGVTGITITRPASVAATITATKTSPDYVSPDPNNLVLSISTTGASSGWYYRVKNTGNSGYQNPDNTPYNTATWTMTSGLFLGANNFVVELYDGSHVKQAESATITVTAETAYPMTIAAGAGGSVSPSGEIKANESGNHIHPEITATPSSGYHFVNWTLSNANATLADASSATTTISSASGACTITANFAAIPVSSISLNKTSTTLTYGGSTEKLSVTSVLPANALDNTYTWSSSNDAVATVTSGGVVSPVAAGSCEIYATANDGSDVKGTCVVTVNKADLSVTATAGTATSVTHNSATLPFTLSSTTGVASVTIEVYNSDDSKVATISGVTAATSGSASATGLSASTTYYFRVTPIGDANHNDGSESAKSATFTTSAAPTAECITWEGDPSSWTSHSMTVDEKLVLEAVGKDWAINSNSKNKDYAVVWYNDKDTVIRTVIAIDDHSATKYLQGSFVGGSAIQSLTIGAANNNGTAGTNKKYVVLFSTTEAFTNVLAYATDKYAQEITAPSYKDQYNASNLEKSITVPSGAKFFRIYRKVEKDVEIGDFTADKDYGSDAKIRIYKIEACPEGSACTDPTIAWSTTPANGLVGGSMTASVTSNYPAGVTYSSSDATVASVNASTGVISYLKAGSATITATVVGDGTTYCDDLADEVSQEITVTAVATGIAISPTTIDVQVGGTADLTATLTPAGAADETVTWTSEYTANATVALADEDEDKAAVVTGVALRPSGEAFKIYAKTSRLTANSWYATVRVYKGVTYDATTNEGSCATASAKYYGDAALVLPAATKDGYTFNGWYTTASGDGTKIGETGDEYTPTANSVTLYARFTENVETYAITYELNSGTHGSNHPTTGTPDAAHELSAPTRSGYTFVGWTVSPVVSGAKWGTTSSPTTDITDASTLAENGTSSVYFKNLAAANGAVTITAHWTQDCETSGGGGGGSTTLFNVDFTDETTEQIKAATDGASWVAKTYDSYSMYFGSKNANTGVIDIINETGLQFTGNNINNYNCLAIPLSLTKDKEVTAVITLGDATKIGYKWVSGSLPATPSVSSPDTYGTNSTTNTLTYTPTSTGNYVLYLGRSGSSSGKVVVSIVITQAGGDPVVTPCYHVTYHANGAERGTVEDAARYEEDDLVTVKPNGFTKAGADFLGWATSESRADAGTIDYDPDDDENNSFTMGTADVDLWAVWGTAAPRVYSLTGSTYRCTSDDASTITLAGSETDVDYQLQKDGVNDGAPVSGTGSALNWSKTAWGTYTVVATRSAVSVDMSGEVVLSDYPLSVTENLDGGTVAQDGEFTLSAKVSVNADNSASYTYQWFSNNAANYDTPLSLGSATAMAASTGTQEFEYNPSTASGGTKYYFCEFKSPCNTVVRTRVVSVTVTTSTTTLTWDRDGEGDDFEDLPQGGKHLITVSSNSGVAPSLAVAGTDAEITNVEQEGSTTRATLILGASAADVVLTAEVSANGTYAAKSEDKEVIVKECSAGSETVLLSAYLSAYNAFTKDEGSGTATISNAGSDTHVTCSEKNYYKMVNGSTYYTFTLGGKEKFQAGDRIVFDVASSDQGNEKDFNIGLKASTSGSELHSLSTTLTTCDEKVFTIPAGSGLIDGNTVVITRASSENRVYGVSIVRGGGSGSSADVPSGIDWIVNPDPGHDQGEKAITRSISNDPFTYAVRATTPSMGTITYESSDEDVATVDANGRVTLIGEGTTTISAKQEAIGCYLASSTLSYSLTVESCTGEKEPVITYDGTVICPGDIQTLTATNYEDDATFQWYKDGAEIDGADETTYDADEAGTYTVVAHKDCYSESSNSVTLTKMSATVDVKTLADEFTIKSERPYNFRLFEIEDGATMEVQSRSDIDAENSVVTLSGNIISISGTAPTIASAGDATVVIRISRTACTSSYVDKTVTIHKIPATAKPTIAWIATKTTIKDKKEVAVKGVKDEVDADKSSDVDLYQELEKYYTVTARNCYWTTNEADLVKEYSQYDLIVLTDYPNSQTAPSGNDKSKSYTNAIGLLKDHIPMLTFEAYVAQCPNWEIPSNPKNTSETQNDITLLCNADEIFGTEGKFGAGQSITLSTVASGQALQGFLPADAPFVFMGSITDDATTYIACCERQVNPAARMLIFGLNANTMNNLTSDGKQMVHGFIDYLLISDAASIPDCSVIFNGGAGPADQNWNTTANWEGNTMPNQYASVRIDKPCVVSGGEMAEAGYLKIHTSSVGNTYTGKLTIEDDGVMAIQGTITRIEDSKYTLHLPTRPEDLIIKSTASGQGALIFDNESGTTQARVEMYTKAYYDGEKDHWQYVASPLISANRWSLGEWTYQFDNVSGEWDYYVDNFSAFKALALAQDETGTYVFEGTLAPTSNQKIAMPATNAIEGTSLIGNSWTAPIQIVNFQAEDFGNAKASVYIYETGYDPDGGPTNESGNSGERAAGKWYEIPVFGAATLVTSGGWAGMKVIPAMQAFEVKNKSGAPTTFTMNYERLVRNAVNDKNAARRAPQRAMASVETPTLRITMSDGEIRNDVYLLSGERFSEGYDNGWDGEYVGGNNCSQLYALSPIGNLSMSAQPEMEGTILGFAAGTKTEFTITFHYVGEEELYLNDMEAHRSTLISGENEYTFTAESGERGNRFVIGEQLFGAPEITTGVTDLDAENLDVQKVIYNDKLYIIRGGKVFCADGQLVK